MKILCATDGSGHSEAVVNAIARWRYPVDSEVRIISVVEPPSFPTTYLSDGFDMELYVQMEKNARKVAHAAVDIAAGTLRAVEASHKLNITTEVMFGSPKHMILEDAEAFAADLIVVGSHGHGMLERFLLGSVSQAIVLHARCSVEIVRRRNT